MILVRRYLVIDFNTKNNQYISVYRLKIDQYCFSFHMSEFCEKKFQTFGKVFKSFPNLIKNIEEMFELKRIIIKNKDRFERKKQFYQDKPF